METEKSKEKRGEWGGKGGEGAKMSGRRRKMV